MGSFVFLRGGEIRLFIPSQCIVHLEHKQAFFRPTANPDRLVCTFLRRLHGIVQGIAQKGTQIHLCNQKVSRQGNLKLPLYPSLAHLLCLGRQDHIGCLIVTEGLSSSKGGGIGDLLQITDGFFCFSRLQQTPEHSHVISQVMTEGSHLNLFSLDALVIDLPQAGQMDFLLQFFMVGQG